MDEYRENVKKVQKALNQDAAFIQPNPYLAQRVLNAANVECAGKGGFRLQRKFSLSIILVIIFMTVMITATAAVLLSMRDIVEDHVIPMAQEQDGDSLPTDDTNAILKLAEENNIIISQAGRERIEFTLMQNDSYYKDELVRELAKTEFGENPLQWSLEQQKWYADVCKLLGIGDGSVSILAEKPEEESIQAIEWAKIHVQEKHGIPIDMLSEEKYVIGVQYASSCEEIDYSETCWTVWFSPRVLEYSEYVVYMDEDGRVLALTTRPGLSADSSVNDIYHTYEAIYGDSIYWGQSVLIAFREAVLKSPDTNHQAYLCMMNTSYPNALPEGAIERNTAIDIAIEYLDAETYIVTSVYLIDTDKNPVWKLRVNTGKEQWSLEIDCFSGELCTVRQIGFGDTKWWMPIVRWEIVDEVRENWIDMSPSVG
mgnify:CR=1 FL=1